MRIRRVGPIALVLVAPFVVACASKKAAAASQAPGREASNEVTDSATYGVSRANRGRAARGSRLTKADIDRAGNMNLAVFLESRLAGVRVHESRGEYIVYIGGASTQANTGALVLVDGSAGSLSGLTLPQIATIEVLRDSQASVYGVRGGNGVLVITTRKR